MGKKEEVLVIDEEFRMKVVNFLRIYGYYSGVLSDIATEKKYVSGELKISDIIRDKSDFKELKRSVNKVLEYCYENRFDNIERVMNKFYKEECASVKKMYGGFFDKF